MAKATHREKVQAALEAVFARFGFRNRDGEVWTREHGAVQDWAALEIHDVNRRTALAVEAIVGVRVDPVERLLSQIQGGRPRPRAPTYVQRLSQLHYEGTTGIRTSGSRWMFEPADRPFRVSADFAAAFEASALPFLERMTSLDAVAAEMSAGRVDGEVAWRLPVLHLLRADPVAAREVLEQATRWMSEGGNAEAYRTFALEVVRRLGDATLVETPSEELVSVLRPALRAAYPDRAAPILAALVRSFWWEAHPRSGDAGHCAFCGATDVEARLFGRTHRICDTCVAAAQVMLEHPAATGASRRIPSTVATGARRGQPGPPRLETPPAGATAESFAADAVRALRGSVDEAERYIAPVERRLLSAPADRPADSVCLACGPIRPPRNLRYEWRCSFCGNHIYEETTVDAGRASICEACVTEMFPEVAEDRRLG